MVNVLLLRMRLQSLNDNNYIKIKGIYEQKSVDNYLLSKCHVTRKMILIIVHIKQL
jgi:hypothetical protein